MGSLPKSYLVFDIETTGVDINIDLAVQLGWAVVENGAVVDSGARFMNIAAGISREDMAWLENRVSLTKSRVEYKNGIPSGKVYAVSIERILSGENPEKVLHDFYKLYQECRQSGMGFVAHNGLRHDQPILDRMLQTMSGGDLRFRFKPDSYFDTLSIEKAVQKFPELYERETWLDFARRAYHLGGNKVKGSLDGHCAVKYGLSEKHGLAMNRAHEADFDCVLTHHLLQEYVSLASGEEHAQV
jgi:DNA polymerase III epsilon subunit-like protein